MTEFEMVAYIILVLCYGGICYTAGKGDLLNLIPEMLLEKAKEIGKEQVWCSECAYHAEGGCPAGRVWCKAIQRHMPEDGYCSFGRRKENG